MLLWCPQNSCQVSATLDTCEGTIEIPPKDHDAVCSPNVIWEETKKTKISRMVTLNADSFSHDVNIGATFHTLKSTLYRHRATASPKLPTCR